MKQAVFKESYEREIMESNVNQPPHYRSGKIETIKMIEEIVSGYEDPFTAHCVGTSVKYLSRAPFKHSNPIEDLKKAKAYIDFAIKRQEELQND